jgi:spermidine/putrescine transport system substrate-binding protein
MFIRKSHLTKLVFSLIGLILIFGCGNESGKIIETKETTAKNVKDRTLIVYNWEEYIGSKTLENFEKETGIHVKEIYFRDEEEMLGAIQSNSGAYDLVVASDDLIREMREAKLLAKLEFSKIPNIKHIDAKYLNSAYDPEQKYSIPYLYGTTGMVVNKKYIKDGADSWKVLFDKRYKGKLAMLNNHWEVISVASKLSGNSINIKNQEELDSAMKICSEQKPLLQGYLEVMKIKELLIEEKLWAAEMYSGEGLAAVDENENLEYVIPKEGAAIWVDNFVVLRDAINKEEAHIFLNYILRPEVNATIASELWYATPNKPAIPLMDEEVAQSPSVFPTPEIVSRCEFFGNTGEFTPNITRAWSDLMAKK